MRSHPVPGMTRMAVAVALLIWTAPNR